ncbi:outer membrane beta-barrel protein [Pseudomonas baetica]|uniref:outer membrane beta-barrel protein n=1 Tax=Pseudomonas baetica TaxID=674054 RepID=UPI003EEC0F70
MLFRKLGFVSLLSLLSLQAIADDRGFYLGAGVTNIETDKSHLSDEDNSYKAYAGYRLNSYLAFEGAFVDLGQFEDKNLDFDGKSVQAAVHLGVPLGDRVRLFGSVGGHAWDADGNVNDDDSGVDLTYGAGIEVDVFRNIGVRAEYEVLEVGNIDLNQTTASAYFLF